MTDSQKGAACAFLSYLCWGSMPVYWKALAHVSSFVILCNRVLWSAVFTIMVIAGARMWSTGAAFAAKNKRQTLWLVVGGFLITFNWGLYIWAINDGRILETSLGYYINPLVSMCFGMLFFGERMRRAQVAALLLALAGVLVQVFYLGEVPLVSLGLALSFGLYGVLKKAVAVSPPIGLFIETISVAPAALLWLWYMQRTGEATYPYDMWTYLLLAGTGIMTSVPLFLFAYATKRIELTALGFIQFVSPTMTFLIGTLIYHEPLSPIRTLTFVLIWSAVAVYCADKIYLARRETH
ncbi:MAG: EamA family transporter RarD [Cloacibacillus sp.]